VRIVRSLYIGHTKKKLQKNDSQSSLRQDSLEGGGLSSGAVTPNYSDEDDSVDSGDHDDGE